EKNSALLLATVPLGAALLGFLRYNFNPATVFLGDCGSLLLGFLLGCFGIIWSFKTATVFGMVAPLMAMFVPILDVTLSVVRRFLRGQPIFSRPPESLQKTRYATSGTRGTEPPYLRYLA